MFYNFRQNNSGGSFSGPALNVIVEAWNAEDANSRAESVGLYFNGCGMGFDCSCCGDRWSMAWESEGEDQPSIYGKPWGKPSSFKMYEYPNEVSFAEIHFLNGQVMHYKTMAEFFEG